MTYIRVAIALLFALAIYTFAVIGIMDKFCMTEKSEHVKGVYLRP